MRFREEWLDANSDVENETVRVNRNISWSPPPHEWVKLNVDGSLSLETGAISAGGVIRDANKNWLVGFALNKGVGSVLEAEIWGILEGLKLAWSTGFRKVVVESDSQAAVTLLTSDISKYHPLYNIVRACKSFMEKDWSCSMHHIYRERNRVADYLANLGHSLMLGISVFEDPPPQVSAILEDDYNGVTISRMVLCS